MPSTPAAPPRASLEDRVAWWPLRQGGALFPTLRLRVRRGQLDFETSLLRRTVFWLMAVPGLGLAALGVWRHDRLGWELLVLLLGMAAVFVAGAFWYLHEVPTLRFDRKRREVVRARLPFALSPERIPFDDLHALQILRELCVGRRSFHSYELNLVRHDGRRVNVADHADLGYLREKARRLRAFLGIPIWDGADADAPPRPVPPIERLRTGAGMALTGLVGCALAVWLATETSLSRGDYAAGAVGTLRWLTWPLELGGMAALSVWLVVAGTRRVRRSLPGRAGARGGP